VPDKTETNERSSWAPLVSIYGGVVLFAIGERALHIIISPYLSEGLGLREAAIGIVVAVFGLASLIIRLPVGAIFRYRRSVMLLVVGGVLATAAYALVPFVRSVWLLGVLMALDGVGWAVVTTTHLGALVASKADTMRTAATMAWYSGAQGAGNTIGGVAGGFLADELGYQAAFLILAALPALGTLTTVSGLRRPGGRFSSLTAPDTRVTGPEKTSPQVLMSMPAVVWAGVVLMFYINFNSGFLNTFHPILAVAAGLSLTQVGALATCRSFFSSAVRFTSGVVFSRTRRRIDITVPLAVLSAGAVFLIPTVRSSFFWQMPLFAAVGLSRGLLRITSHADAFEGIEHGERHHGMTSALLNAGLDAGKVAGPALGGLMAAWVGLATTFRVMPVILVGTYLILMVLPRAWARVSRPSGG
jgi:predicted MFS family arabinose efflux permease